MRTLSLQEEGLRRELYAQGYNDGKIAKAVRKASSTVSNWRHRRGLPTNHNPVFEPKTPERKQFEYLLGVIHGDGFVRYGKTCEIAIPVSTSDEEYKNVLKRTFEEAYGYTPHERMHNGCWYLEVHPKKIVEQFRGCKTDGRWIIPKLLHPGEYLAGLWDTDGYFCFRMGVYKKTKRGKTLAGICIQRKIELRQKSNGNLKLILPILRSLGFNPWMRSYTYTNKLGSFKSDVLIILPSNYGLFKLTIPIRHPRKIAILEKIVEHNRVPKNQWGRVGESKLTRAQMNQIGILHKIGLAQKDIAKLFDVSCTTIQKHVTSDGYRNKDKRQVRVFLALETPKRPKDIHREIEIPYRRALCILNQLVLRGLAVSLPSRDPRIRFYNLTEEGRKALTVFREISDIQKIGCE